MNTLTGRAEELEPVGPGHIGIYVCGVTPYDAAHVGHAMSLIVYDVLVRYLRWAGNPSGGLQVTYVSNYTDVDDKLIERGTALGVDPLDLASDNIDAWEDEQRRLGLIEPDVRPRVTREIEPIIEMTRQIVDHGYGYATPSGDVYYRVRAKSDYGKLSHRNIEELRTGTRFEPGDEKEFPLDFALWKAAKSPDEPAWDSPWGRGRPGWHIECSAMSRRYLGERFDIHGGGVDLVFPHHENEIAQAEAATEATGPVFARLWMHNGMVQRDGEKMSKSVGNVVTVEDALARWSPDAIRLFVLSSHYRSRNNLTDEAMAAASAGVERLRRAATESKPNPNEKAAHLDSVLEEEFGHRFSKVRTAFVDAMENDLATPAALATLFGLATQINRMREIVSASSLSEAQKTLRELANVLGLALESEDALPSPDDVALVAERNDLSFPLQAATFGEAEVRHTLDLLVAMRTEARTARDFARADAIRNDLQLIGVAIEDTPDGARWSVRR